jgi:squalene synthase HpnC
VTRDATRSDEASVAGVASASARMITSQAASQAAEENFPVALRMLPRRYRRHLAAVYGFARSADDMGDEAPMAERLSLLDELEADVARLYRLRPRPRDEVTGPSGPRGVPGRGVRGLAPGKAECPLGPARPRPRDEVTRASGPRGVPGRGVRGLAPGKAECPPGLIEPGGDGPRLAVVAALAPTVAECAIPQQCLLDLIQANRQDQVVTRYQAFGDLLAYCRLSANPVGRMVLHVFGAATPRRAELSDLVCTALQLAEHWQDVAEDLRAGRIYLPAEDLAAFGVTETDLAAASASAPVRALIEFEVRRARELLDQGAPIVGTLRGAARAAVAGYVAGGRAALAAITASGHDVLAGTPKPAKRRIAAELAKAYLSGR